MLDVKVPAVSAAATDETRPSGRDPRSSRVIADARPGLAVERHFTVDGIDPFETVEWERRDAVIAGADGKVFFEQRQVEFPRAWSQTATNVVVQKYFRGTLGTPQRESSVRQMIGRVADTIFGWGKADGYFKTERDAYAFRDELVHLLLHQKMAFNSPVWFNVGVETDPGPQCSACFINSVDDSMGSILGLAKTEGMLFKYGSGTGSNLSRLRSSREHLNGGGTASGPVSFMRGFDAFAGAIKSGGKTRRAAKMVILDVDHPDISDFIDCKAVEEKKAWALIDAGYDGGFNVPGGAYDSVNYQNANHSIRVTDEFMQAVLKDGEHQTRAVTNGKVMDTYRARTLMRKMADAAWICGDPGMQFDTTINDWHTSPNSGRINASNPCVTGDTLVATARGLRRIDSMQEEPAEVVGADGRLHAIQPAFQTGVKPVYRLRTRAGFELKLTGDHRVLTANRGDVPACELTHDDVLLLQGSPFGAEQLDWRIAEFLGLALGDGCMSGPKDMVILTLSPDEDAVARRVHSSLNSYKKQHAVDGREARDIEINMPQGTLRIGTSARCVVDPLKRYAVLDQGSKGKRFTDAVHELDRGSIAAILRGLYTADGTVANYGDKSQFISLDSISLELLQQVQLLLLGFGVKSKLYRNRRVAGQTTALLPDGKGGRKEYPVEQIHSLRVSRSSRRVFEREIGFLGESDKASKLAELNRKVAVYSDRMDDRVESLEFLGEEAVYDLTESETHHFVASGITVHNCSEYMYLDDSACNLASLNLRKFQNEDGDFDTEAFKRAVQITITAMEIIVDNSNYPTERIGQNSYDYRPLGLGYANLGALLMSRGLPYDSVPGRAYAAAITSLMCGEAYAQSARISMDATGPFKGYAKNEDPFLRVMRKHRASVDRIDHALVPYELMEAAAASWDRAIEIGQRYGFRNGQATVLAPTGTIAFLMDCDTTGVEPDIALVKYKRLVGGGLLKIVNHTVPEALRKLGYDDKEVDAIVDHIDRNDTIEGAPHLKDEHLPVFDCAFRSAAGSRSIHYMGHIRMMSAVQPFLSGAISKTVNLPTECTVEDIEDAYIQAWKLGLKAIAVYRDGCKRTQPLSTNLKQATTDGKAVVDPLESLSKEERKFIEALRERKTRPAGPPMAIRHKLPEERHSFTHKFSIGGHEGYITVGLYPDGTPGEIFVRMAKEGSVIAGLMDSFATGVSLALQHGVPLQTLVEKFKGTRFEPSGFTGNQEIPIATSIMDYLFRWLGIRFPAEGVLVERHPAAAGQAQLDLPKIPLLAKDFIEPKEIAVEVKDRAWVQETDAPPCHECGTLMVRNGACHKCPNCGSTSGCS